MSDLVQEILSAAAENPRTVVATHAGRMSYADAWRLQQDLQKALIHAKRTENSQAIPNFLLTVEHPPVYTLGKSGDERNLLASEEELTRAGATFLRTDRGGDITYHGPGQLVGYPILDLDRYFTDVGRYLRALEEVIIVVCGSYDLSAGRVSGRTGVWIGVESGNERKICAFGIRCSRWVTMHGFAFNMNTELDFYEHIVPCGISDREVTSLANELGQDVDPAECRARVLEAFGEAFESPILQVDHEVLNSVLDVIGPKETVSQP